MLFMFGIVAALIIVACILGMLHDYLEERKHWKRP